MPDPEDQQKFYGDSFTNDTFQQFLVTRQLTQRDQHSPVQTQMPMLTLLPKFCPKQPIQMNNN
jgi:hypothetical protein